jgi:hypothetical protein
VRHKLTTICVVVALTAAGGIAHAGGCSALHAMALEHAKDMARRNSLDHAGFFRYRGPHGAMAENVAVGCASEACAHDVWMKSPPHRANMMLGGCQAVASAVSKSGRRYWAMEIGGTDNSAARLAIPRHRRGNLHVKIGGAEFDDHGRGAESH